MTDKTPSEPLASQVGSPSESSTPYQQHPADQSFLLQCMLEVQKSIGSLTTAVNKLESTVSDQNAKIDKVRYILAAAGGALAVLLAIGAFVLDKIWDRLVAVLQVIPPS